MRYRLSRRQNGHAEPKLCDMIVEATRRGFIIEVTPPYTIPPAPMAPQMNVMIRWLTDNYPLDSAS